MSSCLTDSELQAAADNEGRTDRREHLEHCATCREKLAARRKSIDRAIEAMESTHMTDAVRARIRMQLAQTPAAGATTLREVGRTPRWAWGLPLAAAAALVIYFVVMPTVDRQTTVSAAEVLGRSQAALASPLTGLEFLAYDLELGGAFADLLPAEQGGRFAVQEFIDHDHDGRYRVVKIGADGRIVAGAADDTLTGTRTRYIRMNGRGYLLRFDRAAPTAMSIVALKKSALQIFIALMQMSASQTMREIDRGGERCYEITIPAVTAAATSVVSLDRARAVVTAADSRLVEFSVAGTLSGQPFTLEFALRLRMLGNVVAVPQPDFELKPEPGDVVLQGDATNNPVWDVLTRLLEAVPAAAKH